MRFWTGWMAAASLAVCLNGCSGAKTEPPAAKKTAAEDAPPVKPAEASAAAILRTNATDFPGVWAMVLTKMMPPDRQGQQPVPRDIHVALIEISPDLKAEVLAVPPNAPGFVVERLAITERDCELDLKAENTLFDFKGRLSENIVRGTMILPGEGVSSAQLLPVSVRTFEGWNHAPLASGMDKLSEAARQKQQPEALLGAAEELRGNPLSLEAYRQLLSAAPRMPNVSADILTRMGDGYVASAELWGRRMVRQAKLERLAAAVTSRKHPQLALDWLADLEKLPAEELVEAKSMLGVVREQAQIDLQLGRLKGDDAAQQAAAFAELQKLLTAQRFNAELLGAMAAYALKTDQAALAKEWLTDIVSLPLLEQMWQQSRAGQPPGDPSPREQLLSLWEKEHGSVEGFNEFLAKNYTTRMEELQQATIKNGPAPVKLEAPPAQPVLVELFTGTLCPPCVAADLAMDALRATYPPSNVIILQYHLHIPGPDPLTNQDGEDRSTYYQAGGTPWVLVDGGPVAGPVGGFLQNVAQAYQSLRTEVDVRLKTPQLPQPPPAGSAPQTSTEAKPAAESPTVSPVADAPANEAKPVEATTADVKSTAPKVAEDAAVEGPVTIALTAAVAEGELKVEANVTGVPEDQQSKVRLRLVLVEQHVSLTAQNGIREHWGVVREMLGGAKGVAMKRGKLAYSASVPLGEIQQRQHEYITRFAANRGFEFPVLAPIQGPVSVVAFVQNDETRAVLQTVQVPVAGDFKFPAPVVDAPKPPDASTTPATPQPAAPKPNAPKLDAPPPTEATKPAPAKPEPAPTEAPQTASPKSEVPKAEGPKLEG